MHVVRFYVLISPPHLVVTPRSNSPPVLEERDVRGGGVIVVLNKRSMSSRSGRTDGVNVGGGGGTEDRGDGRQSRFYETQDSTNRGPRARDAHEFQ